MFLDVAHPLLEGTGKRDDDDEEGAMVFDLTAEQGNVGLRAMKVVAAANGEFAEAERALLESAAGALGIEVDVGALEAVEPEEVAAAFPDRTGRQRVLQAMIVMALIDGDASKQEVAVIDRFATVLGVDEPRTRSLHHLLAGRIGLMRFDLARRQPLVRKMMKQAREDKGLLGAIGLVKQIMQGHGNEDPDLAWRYKQLGLLPEGTFGREFWKHMTERRFAFPGEPGGIGEIGIHHDLTHVLTGYDTDPEGEAQIASFYAGYFKEDPFSFIFMVMVMFHLGIKLAPLATPAKGKFDPEKVIRAMKRGAQINIDLTDRWNPWEVLELPIDEVRHRYNIAPA